jgi:pSer/pThr/pTyr-binding forkhead associated (FHA) protein
MRVGTPDGLNPFGATFAPHHDQGAQPGYQQSPYGPPPAGLGGQPQQQPPPQHYAPPQQQQPPQHYAPPQQQQPIQPHAPQPAPWGGQNPAAFAETANPGPPQQHQPQPHQAPQPQPMPEQARGPSHPPPGAPAPGPRDPEYIEPDAPRVLAGFLVSYENSPLGSFFPIYQGQNAVGRKGAAPGLSIEFDHATTSSRHAVLLASARPGRIKLEDLGSTNGTFVGDLMLERGRRHELKDGDVIRFGGYVTIVKIV